MLQLSKSQSLEPVNATLCRKADFADAIILKALRWGITLDDLVDPM